jgi:AraC family transcriptional regulator
MSEVRSYREWYRAGPLAAALVEHRLVLPETYRLVQAGPVDLINVSPPAGAVVEPAVPEYAAHLLLDTAPLMRVGFNRPPRWLAVTPGAMLLAPPNTPCEYVADAPAHVLTVAIPKACVDDFTAGTGSQIDIQQEEVLRDPALAQQLVRLWHEAADEAAASTLFADEVMRTLLATLARRTHPRAAQRRGRERLPNQTVRRLRDYVESRLGDELDVPTLADVAGLSPAHFARAFATTVGMTPFRYVMSRRLARARERLERTRHSTLDIAIDLGFKTPSHFADRFRREFGVTPRSVRCGSDRARARLDLAAL